jgi:tetratricopeptide (TPR) repeat protein
VSGDDARAAQACYVLGTVNEREGKTREMEAISRRGLDHAKRSARRREEAGPLWNLAWALRTGATPVPDAVRECEELAQWRGTHHPGVLCELANLRAMSSEFDSANELITRARRLMTERMRLRRPLMFAAQSAAAVEALAGDADAAERELRAALGMALDFQERNEASKIAAELSRVLSMQGRPQEAETFAMTSAADAPTEGVAAQALWRAARARVMVAFDNRDEAERLIREAVRRVPSEIPNLRADLLIDLAEILLAGEGRGAAMPIIQEAIELYERKRNSVSAARARSIAGQSIG